MSTKIVCIIGGGTAGLCALKNCLEKGLQAVSFEKGSQVGGAWVYNDNISKEDCPEDVHSSAYEGLRTNLPKEAMGFPDFSYPDDIKESFVKPDTIVSFLNLYAEHFKLREHIKVQHEIIRVRPRSFVHQDKRYWEIMIKNLLTGEVFTEYYDFVFVCNGHYTYPAYPKIENMDKFKGKTLHSHLFRKASDYKDETVLVIGGGASGIDIVYQLKTQAKKVILSHRCSMEPTISNIILKPSVLRFTENGAIFKDGSEETFSVVIFSTGYSYWFPFISTDCEIFVKENSVQQLYKHLININHPTMALIGLPYKICPTHMFDLQIRFALKYFLKEKSLPSREEMLEDVKGEMEERKELGLSKRQFHEMGEIQFDYYQELADTAEIEPIKPIIINIMKDIKFKYIFDLENYRNNIYKILDDENFIKYQRKL